METQIRQDCLTWHKNLKNTDRAVFVQVHDDPLKQALGPFQLGSCMVGSGII